MVSLRIALHHQGWLQLGLRKLKPDFTAGQIHRWRFRLGPFELRGWRRFEAPTAV